MNKELMKVSELHFYDGVGVESNKLVFTYYAGFRITILDRMTGFGDGQRDIETGLKDYRLEKDNDFWLASGRFDIREFPELTVEDAIIKIKEYANTVIPVVSN